MKKHAVFLSGVLILCFLAAPASATLIGVSGQGLIIPAPTTVEDDTTVNTIQWGFDEKQDVLLTSALAVDGGFVSAGATVDSHMIFLNTAGTTFAQATAIWDFDGDILGVMSNGNGSLEVNSSGLLGAAGTTYPTSPFSARGLETNDDYVFIDSDSLEVYMRVTEPGDWIRVITAAKSVPEPSTMLLIGLGIIGVAICTRKTFNS